MNREETFYKCFQYIPMWGKDFSISSYVIKQQISKRSRTSVNDSSGKYHPVSRSRSRNWPIKVLENQKSLVPILTEKARQTKTISLSWCQFLRMQMLLYVITNLRAFLWSSGHAGNVRKFMGFFYFFWNSPFFILLFLFFSWTNTVSCCWCFLLSAEDL